MVCRKQPNILSLQSNCVDTVRVTIRNLRWEDFRQHTKNFLSYYDEAKKNPNLGIMVGGKRPKMAEEIEWFSTLYKNTLKGDAVTSVAEADGKIVGMCNVITAEARAEVRHCGTLGIAIIKEYRGKGIGEKLIRHSIRKSRGKFEIIKLGAFANNAAAIRLYKKCGFREYGLGKRFIRRGDRYIDEVFMSMEL